MKPSRYFLDCDCGATLAVNVGQAGRKVECEWCEKETEVPRLSHLRETAIPDIRTAIYSG
jgi:hypothetical protein